MAFNITQITNQSLIDRRKEKKKLKKNLMIARDFRIHNKKRFFLILNRK